MKPVLETGAGQAAQSTRQQQAYFRRWCMPIWQMRLWAQSVMKPKEKLLIQVPSLRSLRRKRLVLFRTEGTHCITLSEQADRFLHSSLASQVGNSSQNHHQYWQRHFPDNLLQPVWKKLVLHGSPCLCVKCRDSMQSATILPGILIRTCTMPASDHESFSGSKMPAALQRYVPQLSSSNDLSVWTF